MTFWTAGVLQNGSYETHLVAALPVHDPRFPWLSVGICDWCLTEERVLISAAAKAKLHDRGSCRTCRPRRATRGPSKTCTSSVMGPHLAEGSVPQLARV